MRILNARRWQFIAGGAAAVTAGVVGLAGVTTPAPVWADPVAPGPAPATVTETVTVNAAPSRNATPGQNATPVAATPTQAAIAPAASGTLEDYFHEHNVKMEPQHAADFTALSITLPMPAGWSQVPDPNVPDAFAVIADRAGGDGLYTSNAQLVVYKLVGSFDPREAISHGFVDAQKLKNWQSTDASFAEFNGFPSSLLEGTYKENDSMINTSRRHVIATAGSDRYLVSLSVNTAVGQVVASADATNAIINGFRVADPTAAPAAVPAVPGATPGVPAASPSVPAAQPGAPAAVQAIPPALAATPAAVPAAVPAR
ncbi:MAG: LpqN/LpqT family lipoprotein [Mycolicibacterium insubricum]